MHTCQEDLALRAWVDSTLTPWVRALDRENDPTRSLVFMDWARNGTGAVVQTPIYHAVYDFQNTLKPGVHTPNVGGSAHARLRVAEHHDAVVDGFAHLLGRLLPLLHPDVDAGQLRIGWSEGHLHLALSFKAYNKHYSGCCPARDGQVARSIEDLVHEIMHPGRHCAIAERA
jgi:hypothetical protein